MLQSSHVLRGTEISCAIRFASTRAAGFTTGYQWTGAGNSAHMSIDGFLLYLYVIRVLEAPPGFLMVWASRR